MIDFLAGALIATLLTVGVAAYLKGRGLEDCERNLPRAEKCVKQWVPERNKKQEGQSNAG